MGRFQVLFMQENIFVTIICFVKKAFDCPLIDFYCYVKKAKKCIVLH